MNKRVYNALRKIAAEIPLRTSKSSAGVGKQPKIYLNEVGQPVIDTSANEYFRNLVTYGLRNKMEMFPFANALKNVFTRVPADPSKDITNEQLEDVRHAQADAAIPNDWKFGKYRDNEASILYEYLKRNGAHHQKLQKDKKLNSVPAKQRELPIPAGLSSEGKDIAKKVGPTMAYAYPATKNNQYVV